MRELGELILERNHKKIYRHDGVITKVFDHEHYHDSDVLKEAMNQAYARESVDCQSLRSMKSSLSDLT